MSIALHYYYNNTILTFVAGENYPIIKKNVNIICSHKSLPTSGDHLGAADLTMITLFVCPEHLARLKFSPTLKQITQLGNHSFEAMSNPLTDV